MTTKTMKSAIIAGLTALVILGCFAGAASAAELNFTFNGSTTPIYTLNGVNWIPFVAEDKEVSIDATLKATTNQTASYLLNMTFNNGSKKLLPVFTQVGGWDQINVNNKSNGHIVFDSAVVNDTAVVSVNGVLFNMSIIPNEDNVSYYKGTLTPYEINISYAQSELGTNATDNNIENFGKVSVTGSYQFNILPDPFYNFTVYGTKYYDNNKTNKATAYVYTENGFNNNGKVIVATNISKAYENPDKEYYKLFNLSMNYSTYQVAEKVWNITLNEVKLEDVTLNTTLTGEPDMVHSGDLILSGMKWSDENKTNFGKDVTTITLGDQTAYKWNMKNESVALVNITLGPKAYNASAFEYNESRLGEWNTNVQLPRLVSNDTYKNVNATWWNLTDTSAVKAFLNGNEATGKTVSNGVYKFTFGNDNDKFIELNLLTHENFNITKVGKNVTGNEHVTLVFTGYKLGDVNFDEHVNLVDSAVIGVMIGKDVDFDSDAGTADLKGLKSAKGMDDAITFITADIDKNGAVEQGASATDVNDLRMINMYLIGTADENGAKITN